MAVSDLIRATVVATLLTSLLGPVDLAQAEMPLSLDSQRQLLVDDFAIEETFAIERTMLPLTKHADNPIMTPKTPWEGGFIAPVMTLYEAESREFRMWYRAWASIKPPISRYLCYATSRDGVNWKRPNLGLVSFRGSKNTNIIRSRPDMTIIYDPHDPEPNRRYKSVGRFDTEGLCVAFSGDGLQWTNYENNPVIENIGDSNTVLGWTTYTQRTSGISDLTPELVIRYGRSSPLVDCAESLEAPATTSSIGQRLTWLSNQTITILWVRSSTKCMLFSTRASTLVLSLCFT